VRRRGGFSAGFLKPVVAVVAAAAFAPASAHAASPLLVGVGRADITPPTGYYMMGWVRSDAVVRGQNTRLWARAIVLQEGGTKVALVAEDLNGIPGGMMAAAANRVRKLGFSERNVIDSASHTHAAPTGFYNFPTYNTVFMTLNSPTDFNLTGELDHQLYAFEVRQLALAIRRANADLGPGAVGWGATTIDHLTKNRSLEAHLYDHGIHLPYGQGKVSMDPNGPLHTIDPQVNVLRVDKAIGGRMVPVGMWSDFANHGTVNKFQFTYYNEDHHGAATHLVEAAIRRRGHVPRGQDVVDAYGNTDEGDISSGIVRSGPAAAEHVGTIEAHAFMRAWARAGRRMSSHPRLDERWTRMCFCGQQTPDGRVADRPDFGLAELTGSEEGRGPLYDATRIPFEGDHLPVGAGPQGDKITTLLPLDVPSAVPMASVRVGHQLIVTVPGEMTEDMGRRLRAAVLKAARRSGVKRVVIAGLADEYADYFTTPQEYDAQHYEGAATVYGRASSDALEQTLVDLTKRLAHHRRAPKPYPYDPENGVNANAPPFSTGTAFGALLSEPPPAARRLEHPSVSWTGAPRGYDRPLDQPFVLVQRRSGGRWKLVDSDLGLHILWSVDPSGTYRAEWEPPFDQRLGTYRLTINANHYKLRSNPFRLRAATSLEVRQAPAGQGRAAVVLAYPPAKVRESVGDPPPDASADLSYRPQRARSGSVTFLVNGRRVEARPGPRGQFSVAAPAGTRIEVKPGAARDRFGNRNGNDLTFTAG
jgi:neutral ceramidase